MQGAGPLGKTLMLGKTEGKEEKGTTEDETVGWHHQLNGHEFEQAPGDSDVLHGVAKSRIWLID